MPGSRVPLPAQVKAPFSVYRNGVLQVEGSHYVVRDGGLDFADELRRDRVSGWRWFLGAWGVGTYRQHDSIDIRYTQRGATRLAEGLPIETGPS